MSEPSGKPTFTIVLEALPDQDGPAAPRRLARGLKYLLRACRLRCVECREVPKTSTTASTVRPVPAGSTGETALSD